MDLGRALSLLPNLHYEDMRIFGEQLSASGAVRKTSFKKKNKDPGAYKGFVPAIDRELDAIAKELGMSPLNALRSYSKQLKKLKRLEEQNDRLLELTKTDNATNAHRVVESLVRSKEEPEWLCVPASVWEETVPNEKAREQLFYQIRNLVKKLIKLQIPVDMEHLKEIYFSLQAKDIIACCQNLIENYYTCKETEMKMLEALSEEVEKVINKFPMPPAVVEEMRTVVKEVGSEYGDDSFYFAELQEKVAYVLQEGLARYAQIDYPDFFKERLKNLVESLPEDIKAEVPAYILEMTE